MCCRSTAAQATSLCWLAKSGACNPSAWLPAGVGMLQPQCAEVPPAVLPLSDTPLLRPGVGCAHVDRCACAGPVAECLVHSFCVHAGVYTCAGVGWALALLPCIWCHQHCSAPGSYCMHHVNGKP
jgi:hypothetical protein